MVALTNHERQIVDLFQKVPPERRSQVILALAGTDANGWARYQSEGEARLRQLAREREMHWDLMTDDQRQDFIEDTAEGNGP